MDRLSHGIVRHRKLVLISAGAVLLVSLVMMMFVGVNYDLASYLPDDSETHLAITAIEEEFGYPGTAEMMVEDIQLADALALKQQLAEVEGVKSVRWLDDAADLQVPLSLQDKAVVERFYKDGAALYQLEFWENGFSQHTAEAIAQLKQLAGEKAFLAGDAVSSGSLLETTSSEIGLVSIIAIVLIIALLALATRSWLEPALFLATIGVAIGINMGTDLMFGSVSYITKSTEALLQLAVSMDYSLFLFHRFMEERESHPDPAVAMQKAIKKSISALAASSLTTIAGFAALTFMRYGLGRDLGFVLLKGVAISLVCVVTLLPALCLMTVKWIDKLSHRSYMPKMENGLKHILRFRKVLAPLLILVAIPMFLAMRQNTFLYGDTGLNSGEETQIVQSKRRIEEVFGVSHPVVILVPSGNISGEIELAELLGEKPYVLSVQSLTTLADPSLPRELLPDALVKQFSSGAYTRLVLNTSLEGESDYTFSCVEDLRQTVRELYPEDTHIAGSATTVTDIKSIVEQDFPIVNIISIVAVALILLVAFRSISLPILLTFVIELSIWINMGVPYFQGQSLMFMGYMIVSSIQLGATIDYAILLSDRYVALRRKLPKQEAIFEAYAQSSKSILTSAVIFAVVGFSLGIFSRTGAVSAIGTLIGRGAVLSGFMVLVLLPQLLVICDKLMMKTTLQRGKRL